MHFQDHLERQDNIKEQTLKMQKWCLVNTTAPSTAWGVALCRAQGHQEPQASSHSLILASAQTRARPHLFSAAPQGPAAICISYPPAHTSASNSSDYPAHSSASLCPCPGLMAGAGREREQDQAGGGRTRQE